MLKGSPIASITKESKIQATIPVGIFTSNAKLYKRQSINVFAAAPTKQDTNTVIIALGTNFFLF